MKKWSLVLVIHGLLSVWLLSADTLVEKFDSNPFLDGWQVYGDTNLFKWDSTNRVLDVTWDSTQTNSYFFHPLGRTLTIQDGFCVVFDLQLTNASTQNYGSELAVGLLNYTNATSSSFSRSLGISPNVWEFDYFPPYNDQGYIGAPSLDASLVDAQTNFFFIYTNILMNNAVTYHVLLEHEPGATGISGAIYTNGLLMTALPIVDNYLPSGDNGAFALDTLAVMNYADDGAGDDILAHGTVKNLACASPLPVGGLQTTGPGQVVFASDTNWVYTLLQTGDFVNWTPAALPVAGSGGSLVLQATNTVNLHDSYRVRADLR